jgi:hypothetical protein
MSIETELEEIVPVIFRMDKGKDGFKEPFAIFPTLPGTYDPYTCTYFVEMGGHGSGDVWNMINTTRPAKPEEYEHLKVALERIGYRLKIMKKCSAKMHELRRKANPYYK